MQRYIEKHGTERSIGIERYWADLANLAVGCG